MVETTRTGRQMMFARPYPGVLPSLERIVVFVASLHPCVMDAVQSHNTTLQV
jgi:hypothetical protein